MKKIVIFITAAFILFAPMIAVEASWWGKAVHGEYDDDDYYDYEEEECPDCDGSGRIYDEEENTVYRCPRCNGTGYI